MTEPLIIEAGLFLAGIVALIDASIALALTIFLLKRWKQITNTMRAYTIFWALTFLTWLPNSLKYFAFSIGANQDFTRLVDFLVQVAVYLSGPPLFYYALTRLNVSLKITKLIVLAALGLGLFSIWIMAQPYGLITEPATYFSMETKPHIVPLSIFNVEIGLIFILLAIDLFKKIKQYRKRVIAKPFEIFYTISILIYLVLGSIDQMAIVASWPLIAIRALYATAFVCVYITISQQQATEDQYMITGTGRV
jgi:hypothetical protein